MKKNCLVTGGLGFIGQYVVKELLSQGHRVRILDLKQPAQPLPGVHYLQGSITDRALVYSATEGAHWVFHLAANAGLWSPDKQSFLSINQTGTQNVMDAAQATGVERVVHTSTESVLKTDRLKTEQRKIEQRKTEQRRTNKREKNKRSFAEQSSGAHASTDVAIAPTTDITTGLTTNLIDESVELTFEDMVGAYCQGKFLAEQVALNAAKQGLPVVVVNPTVPIGPGDHYLTPPSRMILGFLNGTYPAFLNSSLNVVDARDVAIGHLLAAEKGRVGERYLLGNSNLKLKDLLQMLNAISDRPMPKRQVPYWLAYAISVVQEFIADYITHKPPQAPLTGVRLAGSPMHFSSLKAQTELGFTGRPPQDSLADAIRWYSEQGLLNP